MTDYENDILNAAQKRTRTGRSFFPAANGQTLIPSRYGTSSAVLPPDQNTAYQAALARNPTPASRYAAAKAGKSDYTWITTPGVNGIPGQMQVPTASINALVRPNTALSGSYLSPPTGPLTPQQSASSYAKGYGAPAPSFNQGTGTVASGGVETPVESLTPQQRSVLPGSNPFVDQWGANFSAQHPTLAAFGTLAANALRGLQRQFNTPAASQYANNVSTGQSIPSTNAALNAVNNFQNTGNFNLPPAPRRYSDYY